MKKLIAAAFVLFGIAAQAETPIIQPDWKVAASSWLKETYCQGAPITELSCKGDTIRHGLPGSFLVAGRPEVLLSVEGGEGACHANGYGFGVLVAFQDGRWVEVARVPSFAPGDGLEVVGTLSEGGIDTALFWTTYGGMGHLDRTLMSVRFPRGRLVEKPLLHLGDNTESGETPRVSEQGRAQLLAEQVSVDITRQGGKGPAKETVIFVLKKGRLIRLK